ERLEETRRQADGDAIADPLPLTVAGIEREHPHRALIKSRPDMVAEDFEGAVVRHMVAGVDATDPARLCETDVPGPAAFVRVGERVTFDRRQRIVIGHLAGCSAVGEQAIADRAERTFERAS